MGCMSDKVGVKPNDDQSSSRNRTTSRNDSYQGNKKVKQKKKCLVKQCRQNHDKHFCRVCPNSNSNSDHFARNCPQSMLAYHGTTKEASSDILANGFKSSINGTRGAGVYFTDRRDIAAQIAKYRGQSRKTQPTVIQCRIPLDLRDGADKGNYGIWHGVTTQQFTQYVVRNPKRIKILKETNA